MTPHGFELKREYERARAELDRLVEAKEQVARHLDRLAVKLETLRSAIAFEDTAYTAEETRPVRFVSIETV